MIAIDVGLCKKCNAAPRYVRISNGGTEVKIFSLCATCAWGNIKTMLAEPDEAESVE